MKMITHFAPLTLKDLNDATQAWAECEYNRRDHSELSMSPLDRMRQATTVARRTPTSEDIELAFCDEIQRTQRRSDGTVTIHGIRFEVPWQFNHLKRLKIRYRNWDLSMAFIVDPREGTVLCRIVPVNKTANASSRRRCINRQTSDLASVDNNNELPVLLQKYMQEYAATGLPPAYIPLSPLPIDDENNENKEHTHD